MNNCKLIRTGMVMGMTVLLGHAQTHAQTWQTADNFQYTLDKGSYAFGTGADDLGSVYVAGRGIDSANVNHALVMRTGDGGATWQTLEDYNYQPGVTTGFTSIGVDPNQNLYALGTASPGTGGTRWLVRKSADHGATWQTVDDFAYASGWVQGPQAGFAADNAGNLYVAGYAYNPSGPQAGIPVWIVRKSSDAGATWRTVDVYQYNSYGDEPVGVVCSAAGVFVAGYGDLHSIVRKSTDGGQTWSIADDYAYPNATGSSLGGLTVDSAGNFYTAARVTVTTVVKRVSTTQTYWVVRRGGNGGTAWTNVEVSPNSDFVDGLACDGAGNVYVTGGPDWVVWKGANQGTAWSVADSFSYGSTSRAYGCASDALGNVYVCGYGTDATGSHWLVRKTTP